MKRNLVRSGKIDQRSRATTRRRGRSCEVMNSSDEFDSFDSWLEQFVCADFSPAQIDLDAFLSGSSMFEISPEERLRLLAIQIESEVARLPSLSGWEALYRIYSRALEYAPNDQFLFVSMSYSAHFLHLGSTVPKHEQKLSVMSEAFARKALELAPAFSDAFYALGIALYYKGEKESALEAFDEGLASKPGKELEAWLYLYHAHCLHDLERWEAALASYQSVNRSVFTGKKAWRADVLVEQQAHCLYMLDRVQEAGEAIERILCRYEKEPHLAFYAMSSSFWHVVKSDCFDFLKRAESLDERALSGFRHF